MLREFCVDCVLAGIDPSRLTMVAERAIDAGEDTIGLLAGLLLLGSLV